MTAAPSTSASSLQDGAQEARKWNLPALDPHQEAEIRSAICSDIVLHEPFYLFESHIHGGANLTDHHQG